MTAKLCRVPLRCAPANSCFVSMTTICRQTKSCFTRTISVYWRNKFWIGQDGPLLQLLYNRLAPIDKIWLSIYRNVAKALLMSYFDTHTRSAPWNFINKVPEKLKRLGWHSDSSTAWNSYTNLESCLLIADQRRCCYFICLICRESLECFFAASMLFATDHF